MSSLLNTQRDFARLIMQPMTSRESMSQRHRAAAEALIKPNDRLTGFERLEIYTRSYWFRIIECLADDFPGVRAIIGARQFRRMSEAYLAECPSRSYTLRNLGDRLYMWLQAHPQWMQGKDQLVLDMVALEWAQIEAFDGVELPAITPEELAQAGEELYLRLQPCLSLLQLHYPVDDLCIAVRDRKQTGKMIAGMLRTGKRELYVAVHRADYSVHFKRLEPEAFRLLSLLRDGASLMSAIEAAFETSDMAEEQQAQSIEQWFRVWQSLGWFCAGPTKSTESAKENHEQDN